MMLDPLAFAASEQLRNCFAEANMQDMLHTSEERTNGVFRVHVAVFRLF